MPDCDQRLEERSPDALHQRRRGRNNREWAKQGAR